MASFLKENQQLLDADARCIGSQTAEQTARIEYYDSFFSQNTIQNMKNIQHFLDVFVLVLLVLIHLYRSGENLSCHDVTHVDL